MPIQCRTYLLNSHMTLQRHQLSIPLLTQDSFTAVTLPDHVDIVIRNDRWRLDPVRRLRGIERYWFPWHSISRIGLSPVAATDAAKSSSAPINSEAEANLRNSTRTRAFAS